VLAEVKRVCQLFGFSVSQTPSGTLDGLVVTVSTMLIHHRTGATLSWEPIVFKMSSDPQGVGSAISYARRYALCTIFEIPVGDDDGRRARDAANEPQYRSRAEAEIRRLLGDMNQEPRTALTAAFKEHFGSNLAGLDPTRDGEALTWVQEQIVERAVADASF